MVNTLWRNWVFLNDVGSSREGEKMYKMTMEVCSQKRKGTDASVATLACSDWRLGVRLTAEELNTGLCSEEGTRTLDWQVDSPLRQCPCAWYIKSSHFPGKGIHYKNGPSTSFTWLSPLQFLAFSKIKKCPEGIKICWHSWHPTECDVTAKYPGTRFSRPFPAVAPLSHKVHSFTRRVFRGRQLPLVHG
jgi:hypothetical protein